MKLIACQFLHTMLDVCIAVQAAGLQQVEAQHASGGAAWTPDEAIRRLGEAVRLAYSCPANAGKHDLQRAVLDVQLRLASFLQDVVSARRGTCSLQARHRDRYSELWGLLSHLQQHVVALQLNAKLGGSSAEGKPIQVRNASAALRTMHELVVSLGRHVDSSHIAGVFTAAGGVETLLELVLLLPKYRPDAAGEDVDEHAAEAHTSAGMLGLQGTAPDSIPPLVRRVADESAAVLQACLQHSRAPLQ